MAGIQADHEALTKALADREAALVPIRAQLEKQREEAIAAAKAELAGSSKRSPRSVAEQEKQKADNTARLEADLKQYRN